MSDWPPKGWNTGTPDEQMECLVIDGAYWSRRFYTWVPGYGWWDSRRFVPESTVTLWRPLPPIPDRPTD